MTPNEQLQWWRDFFDTESPSNELLNEAVEHAGRWRECACCALQDSARYDEECYEGRPYSEKLHALGCQFSAQIMRIKKHHEAGQNYEFTLTWNYAFQNFSAIQDLVREENAKVT